jgi:uncharacterized UPF0160 family protein
MEEIMKAFKPNECDFLILNLLNEYDNNSLMNSLLQDAKERHETFGDGFADCVQFAQTFSNAVFTQTARCLENEKLIKEKINEVKELSQFVSDYELTPAGIELWDNLKQKFKDDVQKPGWTKFYR